MRRKARHRNDTTNSGAAEAVAAALAEIMKRHPGLNALAAMRALDHNSALENALARHNAACIRAGLQVDCRAVERIRRKRERRAGPGAIVAVPWWIPAREAERAAKLAAATRAEREAATDKLHKEITRAAYFAAREKEIAERASFAPSASATGGAGAFVVIRPGPVPTRRVRLPELSFTGGLSPTVR